MTSWPHLTMRGTRDVPRWARSRERDRRRRAHPTGEPPRHTRSYRLREEWPLSAVWHRTARWRPAAAALILVALAASLGQTSTGHAILRAAGLFEEPTSYTSLAFQDPQSPQENLFHEHNTVPVSFVIRDTGANPGDYQWSILVDQGSRTLRVASGSVRLISGRQATITRYAKITCAQKRVRIVVSLARPAEFIDALASCPPRRS